MNKLISCAIVSAVLAAGCASTGTKIPEDRVAGFTEGSTTEKDVIAALGVPNSSTTLADGTKIDVYVHSATRVRAATFVPVVGAFAGGASASAETLSLTFGPNGVLTSKARSTSQVDTKTGVVSDK